MLSVSSRLGAGLPNITGSHGEHDYGNGRLVNSSGAFTLSDLSGDKQGNGWGGGDKFRMVNMNASLSSAIYGRSSTVTPESMRTRFSSNTKVVKPNSYLTLKDNGYLHKVIMVVKVFSLVTTQTNMKVVRSTM